MGGLFPSGVVCPGLILPVRLDRTFELLGRVNRLPGTQAHGVETGRLGAAEFVRIPPNVP